MKSHELNGIAQNLAETMVFQSENGIVALGDSLQLIQRIPDASIALILTDPPYHSTKKENIYGDKAFAEDAHFLDWMEKFAVEFARILKPNGSVYMFCATEMSGRLEVVFSQHLKPLNHITWSKPNEPGFDGWKGKMNKEALRRWYPHSERILFFEQLSGVEGHRSKLGHLLRTKRLEAGLSGHELTALTGEYGSVNHGGSVSNWEIGRNVPSREQYEKICASILSTGKVKSMPRFEDVVRPFNMRAELEYTDVWNFPSVRPYRGKHPAEKPLNMLSHIINASSYEGDIVLDCFAGSGTTGVAAIQSNRQAILIEIEDNWAKRASERLENISHFAPATPIVSLKDHVKNQKRVRLNTLFD